MPFNAIREGNGEWMQTEEKNNFSFFLIFGYQRIWTPIFSLCIQCSGYRQSRRKKHTPEKLFIWSQWKAEQLRSNTAGKIHRFFFFFTIKVRLKILLFSRVFKHTEKPALEQKSIFGVLCSNQLSKKCSFYLSYSPKKFYKKMNFTTTYQECSSSWSFELLLFAFFSCY